MKSRQKKKLTAKNNWYKQKRSQGDNKKTTGRRKEKQPCKSKSAAKVRSLLFVPYTEGGELARRLREEEEKLADVTGYKVKIVERAGQPLKRILHKSNPWEGEDCGRDNCLLCISQSGTDEKPHSCKKRNVVYQTTCRQCKSDGREATYFGESSRSAFERGSEHLDSYASLRVDSHMLKHNLLVHGDLQNVEFEMKILKEHQSAIQRQVHEAVVTHYYKGKCLMNSKSEFSRCRIPRLTVKFGSKQINDEQEVSESETEQLVEAAIKKLRQKQRRADLQLDEEKPPGKRRKITKEKPERKGIKRGRQFEGSLKVTQTHNILETEKVARPELNKSESEKKFSSNGKQTKFKQKEQPQNLRRCAIKKNTGSLVAIPDEKSQNLLRDAIKRTKHDWPPSLMKKSQNLPKDKIEDDKCVVIDKLSEDVHVEDVENVAKKNMTEKLDVDVKADLNKKNHDENEAFRPDYSNLSVKMAKNETDRCPRSTAHVFEGVGGRKSKNKQEKNTKNVKTIIEMFETIQRGKENTDNNDLKVCFQNSKFCLNSDLTQTGKADRPRENRGGNLTEAIFTIKNKANASSPIRIRTPKTPKLKRIGKVSQTNTIQRYLKPSNHSTNQRPEKDPMTIQRNISQPEDSLGITHHSENVTASVRQSSPAI